MDVSPCASVETDQDQAAEQEARRERDGGLVDGTGGGRSAPRDRRGPHKLSYSKDDVTPGVNVSSEGPRGNSRRRLGRPRDF